MLEELKIENTCLKIKQEWNEFQIKLHGTPEQKRILRGGHLWLQPLFAQLDGHLKGDHGAGSGAS